MLRTPQRTEALWALAAALLSSAGAAWVLRLWDWRPSLPLAYSSDALYYHAVVATTLEEGWYLRDPELGAPFGLDSEDFSVVSNDAFHLLVIKVLGWFFESPYTVTNAFFLLTFPAAALAAWWVLRHLGSGRGPALLASVLFALLPYHFLKGEFQLFFASYELVPFSCLLALLVAAGESLFATRRQRVLVLLLCVGIAAASVYYAAFTMLLVGAAAALRALTLRRVREAASGAVVVAAIFAVTVLLQLPTLLFRLANGPNEQVARRTGADAEFFALKLDQLVFPVQGHRLDAFARFTDEYRATTRMLGEPAVFLGLIGTAGFAWLLVLAAATLAAPGARAVGSAIERRASLLTLVAFVFATAGGVSAVIGYLLTAQIRTWSRMGIFLGFLALLAVALVLTRLAARRPRLVAAVLPVLLVLGVLDQTTPAMAPQHDATRARLGSDQAFVHEAERRLGEDALVAQLPYASFPEEPQMWGPGDYEHMRGPLNSDSLRWTYGAMRGREADWLGPVHEWPLPVLVDGLRAAGATGLYIDRQGYGDRGQSLEQTLAGLGARPLLGSGLGDLVLFDLRTVRGSAPPGAREAVLRPIRVSYEQGFSYREGGGADRWWWGAEDSVIALDNPDEAPRTAVLDATLRTDAAQPGSTVVELPAGAGTRTVPLDRQGRRLRAEVTLPPGRSELRLRTAGAQVPTGPGDARRLFVQVRNLVVVPAELCRPRRCTTGPRPQLR